MVLFVDGQKSGRSLCVSFSVSLLLPLLCNSTIFFLTYGDKKSNLRSCEFGTRVFLSQSARRRISGPDAELSDMSSAIWERAPSSAASRITGSLSN